MNDKELLMLQEKQIRELKSRLTECREVFIAYVHEHEPAPWKLAEEIVDRLLGWDNGTIPAQTLPN